MEPHPTTTSVSQCAPDMMRGIEKTMTTSRLAAKAFAEIAQHVEREDQEHHAVVAREARARPVLGRPARELRDAQHGHPAA